MSIYNSNQEDFLTINKLLSQFLDVEYTHLSYEPPTISPFAVAPAWNKGIAKEEHHRYGKKLSNETKKKLSELKKGKKKSELHIQNMSKSLKGRKVVNKGQKGVFFWYNDGQKEYFLNKNDERINLLVKGRL